MQSAGCTSDMSDFHLNPQDFVNGPMSGHFAYLIGSTYWQRENIYKDGKKKKTYFSNRLRVVTRVNIDLGKYTGRHNVIITYAFLNKDGEKRNLKGHGKYHLFSVDLKSLKMTKALDSIWKSTKGKIKLERENVVGWDDILVETESDSEETEVGFDSEGSDSEGSDSDV